MIKAIVTDIEGTTSSLSFVKDVLFPYSRLKLPEYVKQHQHEPDVQKLLVDTCTEANIALDTDAAIAQLIEWIDQDKKITPLKALQGLIWTDGYHKGDFKSHLYQDALINLIAWHNAGVALYVYSSGSILAQKLLFSHTEVGNLTSLFSGYFDTTIGGKKEVESYQRITTAVGFPAENILFLSDIKEELDAAKSAGLQTIWLTRGQGTNSNAAHRQVTIFDQIRVID